MQSPALTRSLPFLVLLPALLVTTPRSAAQVSCPGEPESDFCGFYALYAAQERTRKTIVAAAREAGMDDPSGVVTVRRDSTGGLTLEKWELELPESVEARLNGYLARLVMEHCREPGSSVSVNLDLEPPVPLPHPDSADRPPEVLNRNRVGQLMARLQNDPSTARELPDQKVKAVFDLFVDAAGNVREITVEQSSGSELLDAKIVRILAETRAKPAHNHGAPSAVWVSQQVNLYPR